MARRTVLLISALAVAALGTLLVFLYVRGIDDRALDAQEPVTVLRAAAEIPTGTSVDQAEEAGSFEQVSYPREAVPEGAVSSTSALGDTVAARTIVTDEIILRSAFTEPGEAAARPDTDIPNGKIGVSVNMADPNRVATFLEVGSSVVVFVTGPTEAGGTGTRVLLPEVTVIGIGETTAGEPGSEGDQLPRQLITLAVTQEEAEKLIFAQSEGELYLGLLGEGTTVDPAGSGVNAGNLFPG
jgi:pilus assembly protein CpaB